MNERGTVGVVGILLAAGRGTRFGGAKLLATLPPEHKEPTERRSQQGAMAAPGSGECVGVRACRNLLSAVPRVVAVVRPADAALAAALEAAGACVVRCANADAGMGASLACGVLATPDAAGWIVALGDMPWIESATIALVVAQIAAGAPVSAPYYRGQRGHPVGFGAACFAALSGLTGDDGARTVVAAHRDGLIRVNVDDAGTLADIDRPEDIG